MSTQVANCEALGTSFSGCLQGAAAIKTSLFPVVSSLDNVDANYLTIKTEEGFLVHYHDLQRLEEPGTSPNEPPRPPNPNANVPTRCRGRILRSS